MSALAIAINGDYRIRMSRMQMGRPKQKLDKATSKYKGVSRNTPYGTFRATIKLEGRSFYLGSFENEHDAARAYNKKAKELFMDYAKLNVIEGE